MSKRGAFLALLVGGPAVAEALVIDEFPFLTKATSTADKLVMMHTRKTAGTTLAKVLLGAKSYNPQTLDAGGCHPDPECAIKSFETPTGCSSFGDSHEHYWARFAAVKGAACPHVQLHHWDISGVLPLKAAGYSAITMVREPISLLESSFNYEFGAKTFAEVEGGKAAYFANWAQTRQPIQDQLRMFTGCALGRDHLFDVHDSGAAVNALRDSIDAESPGFCDSLMTAFGKVDASAAAAEIALQGALSNAGKVFDTILLTEAFTESIALLEKKHGLVVAAQLAVSHPTNTFGHDFRFSQLSEAERAKLNETTAMEIEFYQAMVRRFVADAGAHGVDLSDCKPCQSVV